MKVHYYLGRGFAELFEEGWHPVLAIAEGFGDELLLEKFGFLLILLETTIVFGVFYISLGDRFLRFLSQCS